MEAFSELSIFIDLLRKDLLRKSEEQQYAQESIATASRNNAEAGDGPTALRHRARYRRERDAYQQPAERSAVRIRVV